MSTDLRKLRKEERLQRKELRKDRLIQTRVDRRLQKVLMEQARSRRISVSNLVRNVLEDAFCLAEPGAGPTIDPQAKAEAATVPPSLDHVYAWNAVILGRDVECSRCTREMPAGHRGFIGLSEDSDAPRSWLCAECGEDL